jgi:hypothetical protein
MSHRASSSAGSRWSVGIWALMLSLTAATLAAVLGIHSLGDNALSSGVPATSSVAQVAQADEPQSVQGASLPLSVGDEAVTGLSGAGGALACTLLALLCVVTLAIALVRMHAAAARALEPLAGPAPLSLWASAWLRPDGVNLTVLGISRI